MSMRGRQEHQLEMLPAISIDAQINRTLPPDHPLRCIRINAEEVLKKMSPDIDEMYSHTGRPSIAPEYLLKSLLWMALFSIRSERQLIEQLQYNLLAKWFVGIPIDMLIWDATTFSKNRSELFEGRLITLAQVFFQVHLTFLRENDLLSSEHLSVDGTLLNAWASQKSFVRKDELDENGKPPPPPEGGRNGWVDFKGEKRSNDTHISATDPDARLASKGGASRLCHELHVISENRNNFAVAFLVTPPSGTSEREAAAVLVKSEIEAGRPPQTLGGDKNYSNGDTLAKQLMEMDVRPHFPARENQPNAIARQFHDDEGYDVSRCKRMRIEEIFGYIKKVCGLEKLKVRGTDRVTGVSAIALSGYNLIIEANL